MKVKKFSEYVKTTQEPYTGPTHVIMPYPGDPGYALIDAALKKVKKSPKTVDTGMWSIDSTETSPTVSDDNQGTEMMKGKLGKSVTVFNTGVWTNA